MGTNSLNNSLGKLWNGISGMNKYPLFNLVVIYYNCISSGVNEKYIDNIIHPTTLLFMNDVFTNEMVLNIQIKFTLHYKDSDKIDVVHANYKIILELLLFNSKLSEIKDRGFSNFFFLDNLLCIQDQLLLQ